MWDYKGWDYKVGHVLDVLRTLPSGSVQCVVTSPPYFGLRKYKGQQVAVWGGVVGCDHDWSVEKVGLLHENRNFRKGKNVDVSGPLVHVGEDRFELSGFCKKCGGWLGAFGLEPTVDLYVQHTVLIFRELRRVLRDDGVIFWVIGDSYASGKGTCYNPGGGKDSIGTEKRKDAGIYPLDRGNKSELDAMGLKPKDLCLVPYRVALALQSDGWWVRSDIIWDKSNPMPESVVDRPTKSHEYIYMLTKSDNYFWDQESVREKCLSDGGASFGKVSMQDEALESGQGVRRVSRADRERYIRQGRNMRSVWSIPVQTLSYAHFAVFPEAIPERCIKAGTSERGACPKCGAPWIRMFEKVKRVERGIDGQVLKERTAHYEAGIEEWSHSAGGREAYLSEQLVDPPKQEDIYEYLQKWKGKWTGKKIDAKLGYDGDTASHWFTPVGSDHGFSFPSPKDWLRLKDLLCFDDTWDERMTDTALFKVDDSGSSRLPKGWEPSCDCWEKLGICEDTTFPRGSNGWIAENFVEHGLKSVPCLVLDPFAGSGTTLRVARRLGRHAIGIDIANNYKEIADRRALLNVPDILRWCD